MENKIEINNKKYLIVVLANFAVALISFFSFIIKDEGLFQLAGDADYLYVPLSILTNKAIKNGDLLWNCSIDLGSGLIPSTAFSIIGSPFWWISLLFQPTLYPYLAWWIIIIKYVVAGVTSFTFFKRYVQNWHCALLGSILYSFSGFQTSNLMFFSFHDVVALFPLLMIGMDILYYEKRKGYMVFAVAINALTNYYFFVAEVVFCTLYFLIRFIVFDRKKGMFIRTLIESVMGVGISAFLTIPAYLSILRNPRSAAMISGKDMLVYDKDVYLRILKALLLPGEMMNGESCISEFSWSSCQLYIPMFGIMLVVAYLLTYRKNWLSASILLFALIALIPIFNASFQFFNEKVYHRWYFMLLLLLILATIEYIDKGNYNKILLSGLVIFSCIIVFAIFIVNYHGKSGTVNLLLIPNVFIIYFVVACLGIILTYIILKMSKKNVLFFLICASTFAVFTTAYTTNLYRNHERTNAKEIYGKIIAIDSLDNCSGYRYKTYDNYRTMCGGVPGMGSTTSVVSPGIFEFYNSIGMNRGVVSEKGPEGIEKLLSARYFWNEFGEIEEDKDIEPIGQVYNSYITESEYKKIPDSEKVLCMLKNVVIKDSDEERLSAFGDNQGKQNNLYEITNRMYSSNRVSISLTNQTNCFMFFSIPFEMGWKAKVNGMTADIIDTNGFIAVPLEKGNNIVELNFSQPGLWFGLTITMLSCFLVAIYMVKQEGNNKLRKTISVVAVICFIGLMTRCISAQYSADYSDYYDHTSNAMYFNSFDGKIGNFIEGLPLQQTVAYPLWHIITCLVGKVIGCFVNDVQTTGNIAGVISTLSFTLITFVVLIKIVFQETKVDICVATALAVFLMIEGPYYVPFVNDSYYAGQLISTAWHNPTTLAVQGIAVFSAWQYKKIMLDECSEIKISKWCAFAGLLGISAIIKPSFYQMFIPVMVSICLIQQIKSKFMRKEIWHKCILSALCCFIPMAHVFMSSNVRMAGSTLSLGVGLFYVLGEYSKHPIGSLIISLVFPLLVLAWDICLKRISTFFVLGLTCLASGYLQYAIFYMKNYPYSGDFAWGCYLATGICFVSAICEGIKNYRMEKNLVWSKTLAIALSGHVLMGAKWFSDFM